MGAALPGSPHCSGRDGGAGRGAPGVSLALAGSPWPEPPSPGSEAWRSLAWLSPSALFG